MIQAGSTLTVLMILSLHMISNRHKTGKMCICDGVCCLSSDEFVMDGVCACWFLICHWLTLFEFNFFCFYLYMVLSILCVPWVWFIVNKKLLFFICVFNSHDAATFAFCFFAFLFCLFWNIYMQVSVFFSCPCFCIGNAVWYKGVYMHLHFWVQYCAMLIQKFSVQNSAAGLVCCMGPHSRLTNRRMKTVSQWVWRMKKTASNLQRNSGCIFSYF